IPQDKLGTKAGKYLQPSLERATKAADVAVLPEIREVMVTGSSTPEAYPITSFTWLLIYESQTDLAKADAVAQLAWWMIHEGEKFAKPLGYAPLQGPAVKKAENLLKKIRVDGKPVLN